jgi:hypothetical protein
MWEYSGKRRHQTKRERRATASENRSAMAWVTGKWRENFEYPAEYAWSEEQCQIQRERPVWVGKWWKQFVGWV